MLASNPPRDSLAGLIGPEIDARGESPLVIPPHRNNRPTMPKKTQPEVGQSLGIYTNFLHPSVSFSLTGSELCPPARDCDNPQSPAVTKFETWTSFIRKYLLF
jgi:hypothetical protein